MTGVTLGRSKVWQGGMDERSFFRVSCACGLSQTALPQWSEPDRATDGDARVTLLRPVRRRGLR